MSGLCQYQTGDTMAIQEYVPTKADKRNALIVVGLMLLGPGLADCALTWLGL